MAREAGAAAVEPGLTGTNHVFLQDVLALRGAWILLKANSSVSRLLGKACCRVHLVNAPPPPGLGKSSPEVPHPALAVRLGRLTVDNTHMQRPFIYVIAAALVAMPNSFATL